jgi:zinc/manganese transport system substrate-binding protein
MILSTRYVPLLVVLLALVGAACSSSSDDDAASGGVNVVATTTMLGDIARNIVGDSGTVEVLLPTDADPHDFQPSSSQVASIYAADLVVANGLGLEEGLSDVLGAASADGANIIEVAVLVDPVTFEDREPCASNLGGTCDPHVWIDPERDARTAVIIGEELTVVHPSVDWDARVDVYTAALGSSDRSIQQVLSVVPEEDLILITNHDSLGYFADRYGFEVIGSILPSGSALSEPSSFDLAELVRVINETGVSAIFAETTQPTALASAIASESDHPVQIILLYTGSLGPPGSGADTLIGMLETNAARIADGLS